MAPQDKMTASCGLLHVEAQFLREAREAPKPMMNRGWMIFRRLT